MRALLLTVLCWCCFFGRPAWADVSEQQVGELTEQVQELRQVVEQLNSTVKSQAARISELETGATQVASVPPGSAATTVTGGRAAALQQQAAGTLSAFNPEIGVLADMVAQSSEASTDGEGNDKISVRELELIFGHPIDPYSRLDVTATFSDFEEASLEEAYITHWGLPAEVKGRLGRFKPKIGKAVPIHRDSLDTVDEPLVVANYFGTEGMSRSGADFSTFLPVPWDVLTHELTAGILEGGVGEGGTLLGTARRRPSAYAHLKNFWDISDTTNAELGATYYAGSSDEDASWEVNMLGLDATLIHYVTPNNKLKWQSELFLQDRKEAKTFVIDDTAGDPSIVSTSFLAENPWGLYSLLDYRVSPRVGIGGRFDYVEPVGLDPTVRVRSGDTAWSGYLTFYQSEFARWRMQYRHTDFASGGDDNAVFLQGTVAIGVHKHQLQ